VRPAAWAARLGLVLSGLVVGVFAAEAVARLVAPQGHADLLFNAPDSTPNGLYVVDHNLVSVPAPGFSATARGLEQTVPLRINSLGLRGPELSAPVGPRWLAVGDSFTIATQVSEDDSFESRLGSLIHGDVPNAGVDGYSTWQATGRYTSLEARVHPDGVLLTFFLGNDLLDNVRLDFLLREAQRRPQGTPIPRPSVPPIESFLARHSFLYAHWRVWSRARALAAGSDLSRKRWRDELEIFAAGGADALRRLLPQTRTALEELLSATRTRGDRLLVALAPPAFVVDPARVGPTFKLMGLDPAQATLDAPGAAVADLLKGLGIDACDLSPALRRGAQESAMYLTYDGHWTPAGHAVVAQALAACIQQSASQSPASGR